MFNGGRFGPFVIEKELGSGAMGTVYLASFEKDGRKRTVALKIISLGLIGNDGAMARFTREGEILKQLRHPNIVRLIALGKDKRTQTPFIAMEFIDGDPLDRILARRTRFGWEDVVSYGKQLCGALQYAHEKGIIHRDLKPSNLMVTREGVLKLADFGIAKDTDVTALTGMNSTIGTAAYMSPEQCRGDRNLTNKSDLYSLGVVFYELLTGRKPFNSDTTVDMFLKHVNEIPGRPSRLTPDVPVWLDNLVMHLLEKDKDKRPLDAMTVSRTLAEIEEKVRTQASVGADVANARRIDRRVNTADLDASDIAAAKSMRASSSGKKPRKKKGKPWYKAAWLKAVPLVVASLAILGGGVWVFKPPSQQAMFEGVSKAATPEAKLKAAEEYLARYGGTPDEQTDQVRGIRKTARGERLEGVLDKRFRNRTGVLKVTSAQEGEDADAYAHAWQALESEEAGDLTQARYLWQKAKDRGANAADNYLDGWVWLAEKHLGILGSLDKEFAAAREKLLRSQDVEAESKTDASDPEALAHLAMRAAGRFDTGESSMRKKLPYLHDAPKARKFWSRLADTARSKPEARTWFLLAGREREKISEVKAEPALAERRKLVKAQLEVVRAEWGAVKSNRDQAAEQRDCRNRMRDVAEVYADESDDAVKKLVAEANALLNSMKS